MVGSAFPHPMTLAHRAVEDKARANRNKCRGRVGTLTVYLE